MPAPKSSKQEKEKKKQTELLDSDLNVLLEQIKLKNEALKKIYEFFGKEKEKNDNKKNLR
jgi:hypothetical protein